MLDINPVISAICLYKHRFANISRSTNNGVSCCVNFQVVMMKVDTVMVIWKPGDRIGVDHEQFCSLKTGLGLTHGHQNV